MAKCVFLKHLGRRKFLDIISSLKLFSSHSKSTFPVLSLVKFFRYLPHIQGEFRGGNVRVNMFHLWNPIFHMTGKCNSGSSSPPYSHEKLRTSFTKQCPECQIELEMEEVFSVDMGCFLGLSEHRINPDWIIPSPCTVASFFHSPKFGNELCN